MKTEFKFEQGSKFIPRDSVLDARMRLWKSMIEDFELTWLKDVPATAAGRIVEMTLRRLRENRAREDGWRVLFGEKLGA